MNARLNMRWNSARAGIGILLLAALFGCGADDSERPSRLTGAFPLTEPSPEPTGVLPSAVVGQPAPNFTLKTMDGRTVSLSDYRGAPVLVEFWASWCPPCHVSAPKMQELFERFKDDGLTILGVSVDVPFEPEGRRFVERYKWTFPVLLTSNAVLKAYDVRAIPVTFVVDSKGILVRELLGARPLNEMVGIVRGLLRDG